MLAISAVRCAALKVVNQFLCGEALLLGRRRHLMREPGEIFRLAGDALDCADCRRGIGADGCDLGLNLRGSRISFGRCRPGGHTGIGTDLRWIPELVQPVSFWECGAFAFPANAGGEWFAMKRTEQLRIGTLERALKGLDRIAKRRGRAAEQPEHLATGIAGEEAAYFFLRRNGFTVVARRWAGGNVPGDLDLIAWKGPLLCFVEVKTRTAHDMTPAEAAVDSQKRRTLRRLARHYIRQLPGQVAPQARFDVISVYLVPGHDAECAHFENAFGWSEQRVD